MDKQLKLYIGNLPLDVDEKVIHAELLRDATSLDSIKLVRDTRTGKPKGFGFITVPTDLIGQNLIKLFNGSGYRSKQILIAYVKETSETVSAQNYTTKQNQDTSTMSRRKAAKRNFKRSKDDDFNGPWR